MNGCRDYFEGFLGNEALTDRLASLSESGALPHAVLLVGEDGCGRNLLGRLLASCYLRDAVGLVAREVHPDCIVIRGAGKSGDITVDSVRSAAYEMNLAPVMTEGRRVVIIEDAVHLNRSAFAALLKILEQPPDGVMFILTAADEYDVADTVRSRAAKYIVAPLSPRVCAAEASRRFPKAPPETVNELTRLYSGRLGRVLAALGDQKRLAVVESAKSVALAARRKDTLRVLSLLDTVSEREEFALLLSDVGLWLALNAREPCADAARLSEILALTRETGRSIEKNANIRIAAARYGMRLCGA